MTESYRVLLGLGRARRLLAALAAAWLSFGMVGLALFLSSHRATGSVGLAGLTVSVFAIGSGALAPVRGRIVDRRGARLALPAFACMYGCGLIGVAVLAGARAGVMPLLLAATVAGAGAPPIVATLRSAWSLAVDEGLLRRAYALTSLLADVGSVAAPALGVALFLVAPWSPLVLCAVAPAVAVAVAAPVLPARDRGPRPASWRAPVAQRLGWVLGVSIALGAALGAVEVAVPATAVRRHDGGAAGLLLAAFAAGSVAGGLSYGRRSWQRPARDRYFAAVFVLALSLAPAAAATRPAVLGPLLVVAGAAYGPATVSLFEALDELAPDRGVEALTWVTTAEAVGIAVGSAGAGWSVVRVGSWAPFAAGSVFLALCALAAIGLSRPIADQAG